METSMKPAVAALFLLPILVSLPTSATPATAHVSAAANTSPACSAAALAAAIVSSA